MAFLGYSYFAVPPELYDQDENSAATPPAADAPTTPATPGVVPEQAGEGQADCPPPDPPADPFHSQCKRCRAYQPRIADLCADCVADDRDINGLHGAYFELRQLLPYVDRLNDCGEGRVYLGLIVNTIHNALAYARCRLDVA